MRAEHEDSVVERTGDLGPGYKDAGVRGAFSKNFVDESARSFAQRMTKGEPTSITP
jgi:hypothetical protein